MEKIRLIPIQARHTNKIVKWRNNERVRNNFLFQELFTNEMHEGWMEEQVNSSKVIQFIITVNNHEIGSVYFRDINYEENEAEYGIFIGEDDYVGKGYGTTVCRMALKYAFEILGMQKVFLRVFADNHAAISSYAKNGFVLTDEVERCRNRDVLFMGISVEDF